MLYSDKSQTNESVVNILTYPVGIPLRSTALLERYSQVRLGRVNSTVNSATSKPSSEASIGRCPKRPTESSPITSPITCSRRPSRIDIGIEVAGKGSGNPRKPQRGPRMFTPLQYVFGSTRFPKYVELFSPFDRSVTLL